MDNVYHQVRRGPRSHLLNKAVKILLILSGIFMFAGAMTMPIYAIFVEEIGGGITTASTSYALFWLVAGIATFFTGYIENKMKETELAIMWSQFILGIAYVMYFFTETVDTLYIVQILLGIGNAFYWPAFHSTYSKHIEKKKSAEQWGFYDALAYLVPAIAAALGGWLVEAYGFHSIFAIMAALSFFNGFFILVLPRKVL